MRVLFVNRFFYPDQSATSQLLTELAEDLDGHGTSVMVLTGRVDYMGSDSLLSAEGKHKGIEIKRVRSSNFTRSQKFGRLLDYVSFYIAAGWAVLKSGRHDCLIVLSDPPLLSVFAVMARYVKRCKTVCWLQDVFPDIAIQARVLPKGWLSQLLKGLSIWSLQRMDRTVVIGRCMKRHVLTSGIPDRKLLQIPNWADGSYIQPVSRQENWFLEQHGLIDKFVVMYSGNFGVVHEFDTIRELIRRTQSIDGIRFCCIGQGYHKEGLIAAAQREHWSHVVFLPYQEREMMRFALAAADLHLVSLRSDMSGLSVPSKIYGIMAAGRPILFIGPSDSEAAMVVHEADCGYTIEPNRSDQAAEVLLKYYRDRPLADRHGRAGRAYFDRHCDRRLGTDRFRALFQELTVS